MIRLITETKTEAGFSNSGNEVDMGPSTNVDLFFYLTNRRMELPEFFGIFNAKSFPRFGVKNS